MRTCVGIPVSGNVSPGKSIIQFKGSFPEYIPKIITNTIPGDGTFPETDRIPSLSVSCPFVGSLVSHNFL